jgi:NADH-quinone oxidoreductase subunit C/D
MSTSFLVSLKSDFNNSKIDEIDSHILIETFLNSILSDIKKLKNEYGFIFLSDIIGIDKDDSFEIIYHLTSFETKFKLFLSLKLDKRDELPSMSHLWPLAKFYEQELWDLLGVKVHKDNRKRILNHPDFIGYPLSKKFEQKNVSISDVSKEELPKLNHSVISSNRNDKELWSSVGPCSQNIKKPLQVFLKCEDNLIIDSVPKIGHVHRGVEKIATELDYFKFNVFADRINYQSSGLGSISWCKTVEKLLSIEISDRSKALRMVFLELGRIADHLTCLSHICREISFMEFSWKSLDLRNALYDLFFSYNGKKDFPMPARIGGMSNKLPYGWSAQCLDTVKLIKNALVEFETDLIRSRLWMDSLKVCDINSTTAILYGVTGPTLRACGINFDLRKDRPYYFYEEVEFEVPLGVRGDVHDRYLVRFEEIKQSLNIVTQVMDNLPIEKNNDYNYDPYFWFDLEEETLGKTVYDAVESANGEFGFYISSLTNKRADRVKINTPSFNHVFTLPEVLKGNDVDTVPLSIESLNIVCTEHDR